MAVGPYDGAVVLLYVNMSEEVAAVAASLDIGTGNAGVRHVADVAGSAGNSHKVRYVNPGVANAVLDVTVADNTATPPGKDITVSLGNTATAGTISSTAAQVRDAINADAEASAVITASLLGDGTGTVSAQALTALSGGADAFTPAPVYAPVAEQQGLDLDDSMDEIDANSKGTRFSRTIPGRQSGSFDLDMLQTWADGTQARLRRAYLNREKIALRHIIPASVTGEAASTIEEATAYITGFGRSYPDSDTASFSASFSLQENWRVVS